MAHLAEGAAVAVGTDAAAGTAAAVLAAGHAVAQGINLTTRTHTVNVAASGTKHNHTIVATDTHCKTSR